ncbi:hypothetical protein BH23ACT5_BH23ACT5_11020 [soil metagenome]
MSQLTARLLVFFASAAVLVLEILAQRLLASYLGVSLEVFTGVIGVILAGIAVGAWAGGTAADRGDPARLVGPLLVAGGLTALASQLMVDLVGGATTSAGPVAIIVLTTIGFFAPAAVLSAVPPVVVKLRLASLDETGSVVGSYSAIGTAGAIFGTFTTGFVLIAAFPTRPIIVGIGGALIVAGLGFWGLRGPARLRAAGGGVALVAALVVLGGPCEYETSYHCADIEIDPNRSGGRVLWLDGVRNSYVDLDDPTYLEFRYAQLMADVIEHTAPGETLRAVSIGGGGFTFSAYLDAVRPGTEHVVLEIDRELVDIGHSRLGLDPEAVVIVDDARRSLQDIPHGWADLVMGDAFSGLSVPWHLTTVEFVADIGRRLTPRGIYLLNLIDYDDLDFARAAAATVDAVFAHTAVLAPQEYLDGRQGGNFVVVGSHSPLEVAGILSSIADRSGSEAIAVGSDLTEFLGDSPVLEDDFAPVDQMISRPR